MKNKILILMVLFCGCHKNISVRSETYEVGQKKHLVLFPILFSKAFILREREEELIYEIKEKLRSEGYSLNFPKEMTFTQKYSSMGAHVQNALRVNEEEWESDSLSEKCQSIDPKIDVCLEIRFFSSEINLYETEENLIRMYLKVFFKNKNNIIVRQIIWPQGVLSNQTLMNDVLGKLLEGI